MFKKSNLFPLILLLAVASSGLAMIHGLKSPTTSYPNISSQTPAQKVKPEDDDLPLVDPTVPTTTDEKKAARRKAKGQKYSNPSFPISETNLHISHVLEGGPTTALPVEQSDLIIVGEITNAEAVLSNDGTGVYSEFTVLVNEVLKNDPTESITKGDSIVVERQGGKLKLPSGKLAVERVIGTRMPRVGKNYVLFFIKHPDNSMYIHSGYELSGNQVTPLDDYEGNPSSKYKGVLWDILLSDISLALTDKPPALTSPN